MLRFGGLLFLALLGFWLFCLLDAATTDPSQVRVLPKWAWVFAILVTLEVGAACWLLFGRPRAAGASGLISGSAVTGAHARPRGRTPRAPRAPVRRPAPDDDQEFLTELDRRSDAAYRQMLDQWEADLRRREEEARRREHGDDDPDIPPAP